MRAFKAIAMKDASVRRDQRGRQSEVCKGVRCYKHGVNNKKSVLVLLQCLSQYHAHKGTLVLISAV
jgi:hypothetical protein